MKLCLCLGLAIFQLSCERMRREKTYLSPSVMTEEAADSVAGSAVIGNVGGNHVVLNVVVFHDVGGLIVVCSPSSR